MQFRTVPYSLASNRLRSLHISALAKEGNAEASSSKLNPYSRPQDAYSSLFSSIPESTYSTRPPPPPAPDSVGPTLLQRAVTKPRRAQPQKLTDAEAEAFAGLMSTFLPVASTAKVAAEGRAFVMPGLEAVQLALRKKVVTREMNYKRRNQVELDRAQEIELDRFKEQLDALQTDREVLEFSLESIFGLEKKNLFADPALIFKNKDITTSPIYPLLLLHLFILLRDVHQSPHSALYIFGLASSTPTSYVLGCTTALYNELLKTRWMEGDVESLALSLEGMRSGGIRIDDSTRAIITAIGQAMRNDTLQAEAQAIKSLKPSPLPTINPIRKIESGSWPSFDESTSMARPVEVTDAQIDSFRLFSSAQLAAWGRMERIVEENNDDARSQKAYLEEEKMLEWESRKNERADQERRQAGERMDGFRAGHYPSRRNDFDWNQMDTKDETYDGRDYIGPSSRGRDQIGRDNSKEIKLEAVEEEDQDSVDFSWRNFPAFEVPTDAEREKRIADAEQGRKNLLINFEKMRELELGPRERRMNNYSSSSYARNRATRAKEESDYREDQIRNQEQENRIYSKGMSDPDISSPSLDTTQPEGPEQPSTENDYGYSSFFEPEIQSSRPTKTRKEIRTAYKAGDLNHFDGGLASLPKRPSSLNPFKIRRKGLTKEEKARFDTPHPMLFWKKK